MATVAQKPSNVMISTSIFLFISGLFQLASAKTYLVGDGNWGFPRTSLFYDDWAKNKTFEIGDQLLFVYTANEHNVYEVSKADLQICSASNPIATYTEPNATVTLTRSGYYGFICELPGHCLSGNMWMSLEVAGSVEANSPTIQSEPAFSPFTQSSGAPSMYQQQLQGTAIVGAFVLAAVLL